MGERNPQLEKSEHIPRPKRNSFWIVNYLGLPGPGSQTIGVDNQELTTDVDVKPAWLRHPPVARSQLPPLPITQSPG